MSVEAQTYRCASFHRASVSNGRALARLAASGVGQILETQTLDCLESCSSFDTLAGHAATLFQRPGSNRSFEDWLMELADLSSRGFLVEASTLLESLHQPGPVGGPPTGLDSLTVITCDRPACLDRVVRSYLPELSSRSRTFPLLVLDDTRKNGVRERNEALLRSIAATTAVPILYAGLMEREAFAKRIAKESGVDEALINHALLPDPAGGNSCGANRNCHLLATAGERNATVDDDTLNQVYAHPAAGNTLEFSAGSDPCDYWFHDDLALLARNHQPTALSWLNSSAELLGESTAAILSRHLPSSSLDSLNRIPTSRLHNAIQGTAAIVLPGHFGDPGWAAPYGFAGIPIGCLIQNAASHARLVETEAGYQSALTSRSLLRASSSPKLSDMRGMVATFMALDNTRLLPPFPPTDRSQDVIFGLFAGACLPTAWTAHLPMAVAHLPEPQRKFWKGEHLRTASGSSWANLLDQVVLEFTRQSRVPGSRMRMQGLGAHFNTIAKLKPADFENWAESAMVAYAQRHLDLLDLALSSNSISPTYWRKDVETYQKLLREAVKRKNYWHPLDILQQPEADSPASMIQRRIGQLGKLLECWPTLWKCAGEIRRSENVLFRHLDG